MADWPRLLATIITASASIAETDPEGLYGVLGNGAMLATLSIVDWLFLTLAVVLTLFGIVDDIRRGPRWPPPTAWRQYPSKRLDKPGQISERR